VLDEVPRARRKRHLRVELPTKTPCNCLATTTGLRPRFSGVLCFTAGVFSSIFLFRHDISELSRLITVEICHVIGSWFSFVIQVRKFVFFLPKNGTQKRTKFGEVRRILNFDCKYPQNGLRYRNLDHVLIKNNYSRVWWQKFRELQSTDNWVRKLNSDLPKINFFGRPWHRQTSPRDMPQDI